MDMSTQLPAASVHILLALADGPLHGYGILQAVRQLSGGEVALGTGSLYRHLSRLIDDGLVGEMAARSADRRRGTFYRLTPAGSRALAAERTRVRALLAVLDTAVRRLRKGSV